VCVQPAGRAFNPDLVFVSAGFDAALGDPLGGCHVTPTGYAHLLSQLMALADGRIVVALEGGYSLAALSASGLVCADVLLGGAPPRWHDCTVPSAQAMEAIHVTIAACVFDARAHVRRGGGVC
jgi:histone deacetylase 6